MIRVNVNHKNIVNQLNVVIVKTPKIFNPLLGRSWLDVLFRHWRNMFNVKLVIHSLKKDFDKFSSVKYFKTK